MAAKKVVNFRLDEETTLAEMDTLITFLSSDLNFKINRTQLLEMLVAEKYAALIGKGSERFGSSET